MAKDYVSEEVHHPHELNTKIVVYGSQWYKRGDMLDMYSQKLLTSKRTDESSYFLPYIEKMFERLRVERKLGEVDVIAIVPNSTGGHSPTLLAIGNWFASKHPCRVVKIIKGAGPRLNKNNQGFLDRWNKVDGKFNLEQPLVKKGLRVMVLDDQKTTGATFLESRRLMIKEEANPLFYICLGINRNVVLMGE